MNLSRKKWFLVISVPLLLMASFSALGAEDHPKNKSVNRDGNPAIITAPELPISSVPLEKHAMPSAAFGASEPTSKWETAAPSITYSPEPVVGSSGEAPSAVRWTSLMKGSLSYLGVMHAFRIGTEAGTREGLRNSVVGGYFKSLGAMHGWSDGDGYYENYLGHPIEGAVSGYVWIHNDSRYRAVQFGADRDYWMSRLRAYGFAWAFSEQFEIGPISEASVGQIQRYCCAYGFVDHVITPNGGLVWMLAGDALDRYITVPLENRSHNTALRILARVGLNPPQSFANLMMGQYPWHRENRATVTKYNGDMYLRPSRSLAEAVSRKENSDGFDDVPKFELAASVPGLYRVGGLDCLGGGAIGSFRATDLRQWTVEVSGCTLGNSLAQYWSGDSLTFTVGPQWIVHTAGRWSPHVHFRIGGQKITEEQLNPELQKQVLSRVPKGASKSKYHDLYTRHWETTGFSIAVGGGLDVALNRALALRVANVDYTRSWLGDLNGRNFDHGLRVSTGLVLRIGTW
jgi:hypothetical protein